MLVKGSLGILCPGYRTTQKETHISVKNQIIICFECQRTSKTLLIFMSTTMTSSGAKGLKLVWWTLASSWLGKKQNCQPGKLHEAMLPSECSSVGKDMSAKEASGAQWKAVIVAYWPRHQIPVALIRGVAAWWKSGGLPVWAWGFHYEQQWKQGTCSRGIEVYMKWF